MGTRGGEPISVLLVDDEQDVAEVTGMHLRRQNDVFEVTIETSAREALEVLDDGVDCIVSDYEMPDKDGLEFLRDVRRHDDDLPFILFTGRGNEEIASEAISAGVTDYLQKGLGTDQYTVLANRVENAVARRRSEAAAAETKSRYRTLVESSPHAIIVHDGERIRYANDRFVALVGADRVAQVYERDPLSFVHPEDRPAMRDRIGNLLGSNRTVTWADWQLVRLDGEIRHVETRASPVTYEGDPASQVVLRDVTDRRTAREYLDVVADASNQLAAAGSPEATAEVLVDAVVAALDSRYVGVWRADGTTYRPVAAAGKEARLCCDPIPTDAVDLRSLDIAAPAPLAEAVERPLTTPLWDVVDRTHLARVDGETFLALATTAGTADSTYRDALETLIHTTRSSLARFDDTKVGAP